VLCWSEYYNGKLQPTKTSDINQPLTLDDDVSAVDTTNMNRTSWWFWVSADPNDSEALRAGVGGLSLFPSFVLHNTHSSPIIDDSTDEATLIQCRSTHPRLLWTFEDTLKITYKKQWGFAPTETDIEHKVLKVLEGKVPPCMQPTQKLQNAWEAPFFYSDSRHVFYVTTETGFKPIQQSLSYYVAWDSPVYVSLPPLIIPDYRPGPGPRTFDLAGLEDPASMNRFVSQDASIKRGLTAMSTVSFGGTTIGPKGAIAALRMKEG
jgi:hypothetical protein